LCTFNADPNQVALPVEQLDKGNPESSVSEDNKLPTPNTTDAPPTSATGVLPDSKAVDEEIVRTKKDRDTLKREKDYLKAENDKLRVSKESKVDTFSYLPLVITFIFGLIIGLFL